MKIPATSSRLLAYVWSRSGESLEAILQISSRAHAWKGLMCTIPACQWDSAGSTSPCPAQRQTRWPNHGVEQLIRVTGSGRRMDLVGRRHCGAWWDRNGRIEFIYEKKIVNKETTCKRTSEVRVDQLKEMSERNTQESPEVRGWYREKQRKRKTGTGQVSDRVRDRVRRRGNESGQAAEAVKGRKAREEKRRVKERVSFISAFKSPLGSVRRLGWHILGCCFDSTQHFTRTGRSVALNSLPLFLSPVSHLSFLLLLTTIFAVPSSPCFSFYARSLVAPRPFLQYLSVPLHLASSVWISHFHHDSWGWSSILLNSHRCVYRPESLGHD